MLKKILTSTTTFVLLGSILLAEITYEQQQSIQKIANDIALKTAKQLRRDKPEIIKDADRVDVLRLKAIFYEKAADMANQTAQACSITIDAYNDAAKSNTQDASEKAISIATKAIFLLKGLDLFVVSDIPSSKTGNDRSASYDVTLNAAYAAAYDLAFQALNEESFVSVRSLVHGSVKERAEEFANPVAREAATIAEDVFLCLNNTNDSFNIDFDCITVNSRLREESDKISEASDAASNAADVYAAYSDVKNEPKAAVPAFVQAAAAARTKARFAARAYEDAKQNLLKTATTYTRAAKFYTKAAADLEKAQKAALENIK